MIMTCKKFQQWLCERTSKEALDAIPEEFRRHAAQCNECKTELHAAKKLHELLKSAHVPDPGDAFWEEYLTTVVTRVREKREEAESPALTLLTKRLLIPIAAGLILFAGLFTADQYFYIMDRIKYGDEIYSSSFDFIEEEHDRVSSQYLLDQTPVYAVEEILAGNWIDTGKDIKNN